MSTGKTRGTGQQHLKFEVLKLKQTGQEWTQFRRKNQAKHFDELKFCINIHCVSFNTAQLFLNAVALHAASPLVIADKITLARRAGM